MSISDGEEAAMTRRSHLPNGFFDQQLLTILRKDLLNGVKPIEAA
jgi:hypothetical protein